MRRITSVTSPAGPASENRPSSPVKATIAVPATDTLAPTTGSPVTAVVTRPLIWRCWAAALAAPSAASASATNQMRFPTVPSVSVTGDRVQPATTDAAATLLPKAATRKEGKNSSRSGRFHLGAPRQHGDVPERTEGRRRGGDQHAGQSDLPAAHLERDGDDEQHQRQRGERREAGNPQRHPERATQRGLRTPQLQQRAELERQGQGVQQHVRRE